MGNKTPIEKWIEKESTEAFSDKYEQEIIKEAFNELLAYLGLSGIENPREWVEKAKEQVPTDLASFLPKVVSETKNILNELKVINLTNEVTKLQSELKQAKAAKSEAWDKGFMSGKNYVESSMSCDEGVRLPENPYKPDFNQNSMFERFGDLEQEFKVE